MRPVFRLGYVHNGSSIMETSMQEVRGRPVPLAEAAGAVLLVAALLFGGGSRGTGDMVVHLAAVPALVLGLLRWRHADATRAERLLLYVFLAALALSALQLVPLPASFVAQLPQRAGVLADLRVAGVEPVWLPMTLDRWGTVRAMLAIATTAAMWLLCSTLPPRALERLLQLATLVAIPLVLLGFAQSAAGSGMDLHVHEFQNTRVATGLFANRNHMAALLAMLVPLAMVFGHGAHRERNTPAAFGGYGVLVLLMLGAAMTFSRAGVLLASVAAVGMALLLVVRSGGAGRNTQVGWLLALLLAVLAVANYAWGRIIDRFAADPLGDRRWDYVEHGLNAIKAWSPWGSGLGSFREAYAPYEPVEAMASTYALHAHNELVEVAVEAGLPGVAMVALLVSLVVWTLARLVRYGRDVPALAQACAVAAVIPLGHGLVDYPLRTLTVATVFALALAYCMPHAAAPGTRKTNA